MCVFVVEQAGCVRNGGKGWSDRLVIGRSWVLLVGKWMMTPLLEFFFMPTLSRSWTCMYNAFSLLSIDCNCAYLHQLLFCFVFLIDDRKTKSLLLTQLTLWRWKLDWLYESNTWFGDWLDIYICVFDLACITLWWCSCFSEVTVKSVFKWKIEEISLKLITITHNPCKKMMCIII